MTTNDSASFVPLAANVVLVAICAIAGWFDIRYGKIPNKLTYPGLIVGLLLTAVTPGELVTERLIGVVLAFASLFIFWQKALLGGGDVKLTMLIGAFKGPIFVLHFLMYVFSLCVIVILFVAVYRVGIVKLVSYVGRSLLGLFMYRFRPLPMKELEGRKIPFAAVAVVALLICLYIESRGLLVSPIG